MVIRLGVEVSDADLDKAVAGALAKSAQLVEVIHGLKVDEGDLSTTDLLITSRFDPTGEKEGVIGYTVSRLYTVNLKEVAGFSKFVQACLKGGANAVRKFEFRSSADRQHTDEARKLAVRAAKEKAILLAGELGAKVGSVQTISEDAYGNVREGASFFRGGAGGGEPPNDLPAGKIEIRASVNVTFTLE